MEFLVTFLNVFLIVIKWIFVTALFLFAMVLAIGAAFSWFITCDEKKMSKEDDAGWKMFGLIAIVLTVLSLILALFGYLII